jgi:hypothetical protein
MQLDRILETAHINFICRKLYEQDFDFQEQVIKTVEITEENIVTLRKKNRKTNLSDIRNRTVHAVL